MYYEIVTTYHPIHSTKLSNKHNARTLCVVYYQREVKGVIYVKKHTKVTGIISYEDTGDELHPAVWSDAIEEEFIAKRDALPPLQSSIKLHKRTYVFAAFLAIVFSIAGYVIYDTSKSNASFEADREEQEQFRKSLITQPKVGAFLALYDNKPEHKQNHNTFWGEIIKVGKDTITLKIASKPQENMKEMLSDIKETEIIKISTFHFKENSLQIKHIDGQTKYNSATLIRIKL